jgi:hypothetical protein
VHTILAVLVERGHKALQLQILRPILITQKVVYSITDLEDAHTGKPASRDADAISPKMTRLWRRGYCRAHNESSRATDVLHAEKASGASQPLRTQPVLEAVAAVPQRGRTKEHV